MTKKKSDVFVYMVLVAAVLLVKVLGLVRGMFLSAMYGTGVEASAFTAVSNLPLIIFDVTFGTAITSAFVPVFNEKLSSDSKDGANRFASNFFNIVLIFSIVFVALGMIFPKQAVLLVASGFNGQTEAMTIATTLMRIISPIVTFACCTYIFIGILQSFGEFIAPALVSLFSNLSMIVYLVFFNKSFGINGLAVAFCFGWFLQFVFLLPFLKKKEFKYTFNLNFKSKDIKKVAVLTLPLFVAALAQPINQLISSNFSSSVSEKGIATVNYAYNAYLIVAGVFSYALSNMFFPKMSRKFAENDIEGATVICKDMLSSITAIILPIMLFVGICSKPIISVLYQRGEFTASDTQSVAALLTVYAVAMISLSWQDIFNKYFYSMQKSVVPMISAFVGITSNILFSVILTPKIGLLGLAVSTVIAGYAMSVVLALFSLKVSKSIFTKTFVIEISRLILAALVSGTVCFICTNAFDFDSNLVFKITYILITLIATLVSYVIMLFVLRSENVLRFKSVLRKEGQADV